MYKSCEMRNIHKRFFPGRGVKRYRIWYCLEKMYSYPPDTGAIFIIYNGYFLIGVDGDCVELLQWFKQQKAQHREAKRIQRQKTGKTITNKTVEIHNLFNHGMDRHKIAEEFNLSVESVGYHLRKSLDKEPVV